MPPIGLRAPLITMASPEGLLTYHPVQPRQLGNIWLAAGNVLAAPEVMVFWETAALYPSGSWDR
jgi:hypothetical protein